MAEERDTGVLVIGGGLLLVGGYFLYQSWQRDKAAETIRESWNLEAETANTYLEQITAGGREPTAEEWEIYNSMIEEMRLKEERIYELSRSEFERVIETAADFAKRWYLIPLWVAAPVAGYIAIQLFRDWFRHKCIRCNPPTCAKCGRQFSTEEELQNHIATEHAPTATIADIAKAQSLFAQVPYWVAAGVAAEAELWDRVYKPWWELEPAAIYVLAFALMVIVAIGAVPLLWGPSLEGAVALLLI